MNIPRYHCFVYLFTHYVIFMFLNICVYCVYISIQHMIMQIYVCRCGHTHLYTFIMILRFPFNSTMLSICEFPERPRVVCRDQYQTHDSLKGQMQVSWLTTRSGMSQFYLTTLETVHQGQTKILGFGGLTCLWPRLKSKYPMARIHPVHDKVTSRPTHPQTSSTLESGLG